ncbi:MAG: ferric reductase-like transmembrane domain-containing protein [Desulfosarcina sp.]
MDRPLPGQGLITVGKILPAGMRYLSATLIVLVILLLVAGALAIPFLFESPSIWYKFGIDKLFLRAGKMLGLVAGLLILLQLPMAGRLKLLDRIFSLPGLMRQHRAHAWIIAVMALMHPVGVLFSEGLALLPLEMRYWPEWLGVGLLILVLIQFVGSRWRGSLRMPFHVWMPLHRILGLSIAVLLVVHVRFVSETFNHAGLPRQALLVAASLFSMVWLWVRSGWLRCRRRPWFVSRIEHTGGDCTRVDLEPATPFRFSYAPGQFGMASFRSAHVSPESHPFTFSSTPSRPGNLQFTIRHCGDWTRDLKNLQPGARVLIQGPFGRFGHLFARPSRELILIAGGIGITPMLSMLRFMVDVGDPRPVTLIWSNRTRNQVVCADEVSGLSYRLTGLRYIPIFTQHTEGCGGTARLNRMSLGTMLAACSRGAAIFVCGPPRMMKQTETDLKSIGFPGRSIYTEPFGF